jgi:hypothetical protein
MGNAALKTAFLEGGGGSAEKVERVFRQDLKLTRTIVRAEIVIICRRREVFPWSPEGGIGA